MDTSQLLLFIAAGLLLNLTPGPDVLYIVTNALRSGARAGMVAALGITAGCFVHIVAAALGVGALLTASGSAFAALKWLGAAYLIYVGLGLMLQRRAGAGSMPVVATNSIAACDRKNWANGLKAVFFQGFWTNVLNPKVALFFLAFVPQFIAPDMANKPLAFLLLGLLFNFNGLCVNVGWALAAAWMASRLVAVRAGLHWLERAAGLMFVGFGIRLALSGHPSR
ncbi:MAG: LysE family translocator [Polaromonas sp.]|nr:LysE family translocator [Polaromonas sp.]